MFEKAYARRNRLQKAKDELSSTQLSLIKRITSESDEGKQAALAKQLSDIHDGIEAIKMTGGKSSNRRIVWISLLSAVLTAAALIFNANAWYAQEEAKHADAALTWCAKLYDPNYVAYQAIAGALTPVDSVFRLPNGLTIEQLNASGPNSKPDEVKIKLLAKDIPGVLPVTADPAKPDIYQSLIGLLNLIDAGALMVLQGDMEGGRFVNCFRDFASAYRDRFDFSYVGLKFAVFHPRQEDGKLQDSRKVFPSLSCVFYRSNCEDARKSLWNKQITCQPSLPSSKQFCQSFANNSATKTH